MKYMNNRFGQSRIFGRAHCKLPMSLQMFAESGATGGAGGGSEEPDKPDGTFSSEEDVPSVEELMAQLAAERAKNAKLQNEKDTASSEAANFKKQLRAKMTAEEQEAEAKAEAEAARDAELNKLKDEIRVSKYSKRYMGIGMDEDAATKIATLTGEIAEPDEFFSALDKFVKAATKKAGEDSVQALVKNNPGISAGNGAADKSAASIEMAKAYAGRRNGVNQDILNLY